MTNYEWLCKEHPEYVMDCITEVKGCETCVHNTDEWNTCEKNLDDYCLTNNLCRRGVWEWLNKPYESASYVAQEAVCDSSESVAAKDDSGAENVPESLKLDELEWKLLATSGNSKIFLKHGTTEIQDTRKRLEADIRERYRYNADWMPPTVFGWLDRQAAITRAECASMVERLSESEANWRWELGLILDCVCGEGKWTPDMLVWPTPENATTPSTIVNDHIECLREELVEAHREAEPDSFERIIEDACRAGWSITEGTKAKLMDRCEKLAGEK